MLNRFCHAPSRGGGVFSLSLTAYTIMATDKKYHSDYGWSWLLYFPSQFFLVLLVNKIRLPWIPSRPWFFLFPFPFPSRFPILCFSSCPKMTAKKTSVGKRAIPHMNFNNKKTVFNYNVLPVNCEQDLESILSISFVSFRNSLLIKVKDNHDSVS